MNTAKENKEAEESPLGSSIPLLVEVFRLGCLSWRVGPCIPLPAACLRTAESASSLPDLSAPSTVLLPLCRAAVVR